MLVEETALDGVLILTPKRFGDARGFFSESWNRKTLADKGINLDFVQDNHSLSAAVNTVRGLHFQAPPNAQAKLVQVLRGEIFDAFVDIRKGSPTYGQSASVRLSANACQLLYVPAGFAHGYQTMVTNTLVAYKVTAHYAPESEGGLLWCDTALSIAWPRPDDVVMSGRDFTWPGLAKLETPFTYEP